MSEAIKKANLGVDEDGAPHIFDDLSKRWRNMRSLLGSAETARWVRFSTSEVQAWKDSDVTPNPVYLTLLPSPGPGKAVVITGGNWCLGGEEAMPGVNGYLSYGYYNGNPDPGYDWIYVNDPAVTEPYSFGSIPGVLDDGNSNGDLRVLENRAVVLDPGGWSLPDTAVPMLFLIKSVILDIV